MSKSIHTTYNDLSKFSKKEIDEMANDPNSPLQELAKKRAIKKEVKRDRQTKKNEQ
jgi:hypothetical protein